MRLAELFIGQQIDKTGGFVPFAPQVLESLWHVLRAKYHADFTTSTDETAAWHQRQAEDSERERQWLAARFHLDWLLAIQPNDPSLRQRRAFARAEPARNQKGDEP